MFTDFYTSWHYLLNHPIFNEELLIDDKTILIHHFQECFDMQVIQNHCDNSNFTTTMIWLEVGPYYKKFKTHDIELDCGGETFEEAIIKLANLVYKKYKINKTVKFNQ